MSIEVIHMEYDPNTNTIDGFEDGVDYTSFITDLIPADKLQRFKRCGHIEYIQDSADPNIYYEVEFPIPDDFGMITFYYDKDKNVMIDEGGYAMFNIFNYVTPSQLMFFKSTKESMAFFGTDGNKVELIYPDMEEEE